MSPYELSMLSQKSYQLMGQLQESATGAHFVGAAVQEASLEKIFSDNEEAN